MSDLLVTSTGEIFYKIDSQIAALLVSALPTVFERVNHKPAAPPVSDEPRWFVGKNAFSDKIQIMFQQGAVEEWYNGPAEHAHRAFGKRQVPADVIQQYAAALDKQNKSDNARMDAVFNRA
jgi:hypothetical protein